ncbi:MAG TPA: hypothetical protein VL096_19940, partial [Pirellulaceae bacterium]|nr:hypothetical protein [Pirellulaceae bacterium]
PCRRKSNSDVEKAGFLAAIMLFSRSDPTDNRGGNQRDMSDESRHAAINPYESPPVPSDEPRNAIFEVVRGPSLGLMLIGGISAPGVLAVIALPIAITLALVETSRGVGAVEEAWIFVGQGTLFALNGTLNCFIAWGAYQMRRLNRYRWAKWGAVAALVPTPMMWVTVPLGIWALVVLRRPEVRAAFKSEQTIAETT